MLKDLIRPLVRPLPQWSTVAMHAPSKLVTATLRWEGQLADVTADHTVASLKPLMIASSLDAGLHPSIEYSDSATGRLLGVLQLERAESVVAENASVTLYRVIAGRHECFGWPRREWNVWLQNRSMLKSRQPHHLGMAPQAVQQLMIAYLCPRPVVLVSVSAPGHRNIFPMDLIGPLERSGFFSLALRSTNVSEPVMREAGQVVLSAAPAAMKAVVYRLSEHHKQPPQDWDALPFPLRTSRSLRIPALAAAPAIKELQIAHSQTVGSHTFFLGRVVTEERVQGVAQLHHTAGFHYAYRQRHNQPLADA
jgi:flavin reductase (DIM6/NTAB) family NADH-FMN oxidoreductase RutF